MKMLKKISECTDKYPSMFMLLSAALFVLLAIIALNTLIKYFLT